MKPPIIGYIVIDPQWRSAMQLDSGYPDAPRGDVLCNGDYAHLFPSRRAANRAIQRSRRYRQEKWGERTGYKIQPVRATKGSP